MIWHFLKRTFRVGRFWGFFICESNDKCIFTLSSSREIIILGSFMFAYQPHCIDHPRRTYTFAKTAQSFLGEAQTGLIYQK